MADVAGPPRMRAERRRVAVMAACFVALLGLYLTFFAELYRRPEATESTVAQAQGERRGAEVYVEMTSVDPIRQAIEARLDVSTRRGAWPGYPAPPGRDLTVRESDRAYTLDVRLPAGAAAASAPAQFVAEGWVSAYPFDVYRGEAVIAAWESERMEAGPLPIRLTVWERLSGWEARVTARPARSGETGLPIAIEARRPLAHVVFALVLYAVMAVIAVCGVAVGVLAVCGARKIEAAFSGALAGMLFAVPMLRNAMPGAPPLGVAADAYVFLWVQVALMIGLALFVFAWARRGSPP